MLYEQLRKMIQFIRSTINTALIKKLGFTKLKLDIDGIDKEDEVG